MRILGRVMEMDSSLISMIIFYHKEMKDDRIKAKFLEVIAKNGNSIRYG